MPNAKIHVPESRNQHWAAGFFSVQFSNHRIGVMWLVSCLLENRQNSATGKLHNCLEPQRRGKQADSARFCRCQRQYHRQKEWPSSSRKEAACAPRGHLCRMSNMPCWFLNHLIPHCTHSIHSTSGLWSRLYKLVELEANDIWRLEDLKRLEEVLKKFSTDWHRRHRHHWINMEDCARSQKRHNGPEEQPTTPSVSLPDHCLLLDWLFTAANLPV